MGCDFKYQGIPEGSGFLELVRELLRDDLDEHYYDVLSVDHWFAYGESIAGEYVLPSPGREGLVLTRQGKPNPLWSCCCRIAGQYPEIGSRQFSFDEVTHAAAMHFVLSAKERRDARWPKPPPNDPRTWNDPIGGFDELVGQAFFGAPAIDERLHGNKGHLVRLVSSETVTELGTMVAALEFHEIEPHLSEGLSASEEARKSKERIEPSYFHLTAESHREHFEGFRAFFKTAAERNESVLVICH